MRENFKFMKKLLIFALLLFIGFEILTVLADVPFGEDRMNVSKFYLEKSPAELKVANVVTAIVVNFRGFDTLGEVTVLFLAAAGIGSILYRRRSVHTGLNPKRTSTEASSIVQAGAKVLFPLILLLGAYVFVHGHLTPGGGFQGGAIIATGFLLKLISYRKFSVKHSTVTWVESLAGIVFVVLGLLGIVYGGTFLENFLPAGELNSLISGGVIGIIYVAVGFKVGSELTGVLDTLLNISQDEETQ